MFLFQLLKRLLFIRNHSKPIYLAFDLLLDKTRHLKTFTVFYTVNVLIN